jgi:hypothetical protein
MQIPVDVPYTTHPRMTPLEDCQLSPDRTNPHIRHPVDAEQRARKVQEISRWGEDLFGMREACPEDLIGYAARLCGRPETDSILQLALSFDEDIAILHRGRLVAICFCFPSRWIPGERLGKTLADIHAPVGDGEKLVEASQRMAQAMTRAGFRRHVWTITDNPGLSQHPRSTDSGQTLFFRTETQTSLPLGDDESSLFLVHVQMHRLEDVFADEAYKHRILESLSTMSDTVVRYKGLESISKNLLRDRARAGPASSIRTS